MKLKEFYINGQNILIVSSPSFPLPCHPHIWFTKTETCSPQAKGGSLVILKKWGTISASMASSTEECVVGEKKEREEKKED